MCQAEKFINLHFCNLHFEYQKGQFFPFHHFIFLEIENILNPLLTATILVTSAIYFQKAKTKEATVGWRYHKSISYRFPFTSNYTKIFPFFHIKIHNNIWGFSIWPLRLLRSKEARKNKSAQISNLKPLLLKK